MNYVLETLEIERGRVARAVRAFEMHPGRDEGPEARELLLRNRKRILEEASATLEDPGAEHRELDPVLDVDLPVEVLRGERARLLEVNRALEATIEREGVRFPRERIEANAARVAEIDAWLPVLAERLDRRTRIGFG